MQLDPTTKDPEIQIEIPTRRGPEPVTSAALHGAGYPDITEVTDDVGIDTPSPTEKQSCLEAFFHWYIYPYKNILFCLKCVLYHFVNWLLMIGMFTFTVSYIPTAAGLIVLACSGLLVFYIAFEFSNLMAGIDLTLSFYLAENDPERLSLGVPRLGYQPYLECGNCMNRIKSVMAGCQTYKTMVFYLLFKPIVVFVTSSTLIVLIVEGGLLSLWIIVAAHPEWFRYKDSSGIGVHNVGQALLVFVGGVILLPFVLYLVMWAAQASKIVSYFFLTNVYSKKTEEEDRLLVAAGGGTSGPSSTRQYGQDDLLEV